LLGTNTNDDAISGYVGEHKDNKTNMNSVSIASGNWNTVGSISLTPGDWDISGICSGYISSGTLTESYAVITASPDNTTGAPSDIDESNNACYFKGSVAATGNMPSLIIPVYRVKLTTTTTYRLKMNVTGTTVGAGGRISARRVR